MTSPMSADLELDCREMVCPRPVIELNKHLADKRIVQLGVKYLF